MIDSMNSQNKLINLLLAIAKGIVTGMAVMIPGVSAGSMIMSMGMYEPLMVLISGKGAERKSVLPKMLPFGGGVLAGIFIFAFVLKGALSYFPFQTSLAFIGLILGGIPMLIRGVKGHRFTLSCALAFLIAFGLMIVMMIASGSSSADFSLAPSVPHFLLTIVLGFLAASTMILPGVSGSALMLIMGYYYEITGRVAELGTAFGTLNWAGIGENLLVFLPFLIGAFCGIVLVAKLIRRLLERFPAPTRWALIGLMAASPLTVLAKITVDYSALTVPAYIVAALLGLVGFAIAWFLSKDET